MNYGHFMMHQTSSMCNPNIQNNILNWLNSEIKKYENFKMQKKLHKIPTSSATSLRHFQPLYYYNKFAEDADKYVI